MEEVRAPERSWFGRHWIWVIPLTGCLGCLLVPAFFGLTLATGLFGFVRSMDAYQEALDHARRSPAAIEALGEPIDDGTSGLSVNWNPPRFEATIPVDGPRAEGILEVRAEKVGEAWVYERLELTVEGTSEPIDLR